MKQTKGKPLVKY